MKWPLSVTLIRHAESQYNELRQRKEKDEEYQTFKKVFNKNPQSPKCRELAGKMLERFALKKSDYDTPLTMAGRQQALQTGVRARTEKIISAPDIVLVSPYRRTRETLDLIHAEWDALSFQKHVHDDRIREQEHGLSLLYNDWRIFEVFHPEQRALRNLLGPYWYQYPQGESVPQVRDRIRSFTNTLVREYAGKHVLIVTHHLTILSFRANFERLSHEAFIQLDETEKPRNCGVTIYRGNPGLGTNGRLELECYNKCLWG
jgi:broad specificity phosphatase PhoE